MNEKSVLDGSSEETSGLMVVGCSEGNSVSPRCIGEITVDSIIELLNRQ